MGKQLIIAGFHRSGTSMLTQELNRAGLFVGKRLMSPNISNADGHFEDMDFFHLHEKLLRYHHTDWQHTDVKPLEVPEDYRKEMQRLIEVRDDKHSAWGFKDPRTVLFLPEWYQELENPHTVIIYRHYSETGHSLLHRAAGDMLRSPNFHQLRFWKEEELSYRMWLAYNLRLIAHVKAHPHTTLVLSHEAVVSGYPVAKKLKEIFGFELDTEAVSAIDTTKLSSREREIPLANMPLQKELDDVWEELQRLSSAPSTKSYLNENNATTFKVEEVTACIVSVTGTENRNDVMADTLKAVVSKDILVTEKIALIRQSMHTFFYLGEGDSLREAVAGLLEDDMENETLSKLYGDLCRRASLEEASHNSELMLLASMPKVFPWNYQRIAQSYLHFYRFDKAEFFIKKAIKANPANFSFYMSYATLELARCRYSKALEEMDKAMKFAQSNPLAMMQIMLQKCSILEQLDDTEGLKIALKATKEHKEKLSEVPEWVDMRLKSFASNSEVEVDFKEQWKENVIARLKKSNLVTELDYMLASVKNPLMQDDLLSRLGAQLEQLVSEREEIKADKQVLFQQCSVSFLVDDLAIHYYQAELLLHSLERFTSVKKENIVVHCTNKVEEKFIKFLKLKSVNYKIIEPYLDGKYCNKLTQLDSFLTMDTALDGVVLLDTDTFFLSDPLIKDREKIAGKVVDASNPSIKILEEMYAQAGLSLPKKIEVDWESVNSLTLSTNFNGGFYYIPTKDVGSINILWKKWAEWLYTRPELFETLAQSIHTDQVSMSMAITQSQLQTQAVATNNNCPTHNSSAARYFENDQPISMLHYHREINHFGLLSDQKVRAPLIMEAINKGNEAIASMTSNSFYEAYRRSLIVKPVRPNNFEEIEDRLRKISSKLSKNIKLILHAGTPKTGTTTLQFFWDKYQDILLEQGVLYAKRDTSSFAPKHQWIVGTLQSNNFTGFLDQFDEATQKRNENTHTILLSTEGIYNHWWDYSPEAKYFLYILGQYFELEIWVWFRDPVSFTESLYRQYLKNPQLQNIKCYGKDMSLNEMMENEWFTGHLDYLGFIQECEALFGDNHIKIFSMETDVVRTACNSLNVSVDNIKIERHNEKLSCTLIEALRIFNRSELPFKEKEALVNMLYKIDEKYSSFFTDSKVCNGDIDKINTLVSKQYKIIKRRLSSE